MATTVIRKKPLNLTKRQTRKLSILHAYSRLYYKKKLKPIVHASWKKHIARHPNRDSKGDVMKHRNAVVKALFEIETDEVKAEVLKRREEGDFSESEDMNFDDDDAVEAAERKRHSKASAVQRKVFFTYPSSPSDDYDLLGLKRV
jgi:hypothetical protein